MEKELPKTAVFALDIGTRSIIGMLGVPEAGKMRVTAIARAEHSKRAMVDGQIEDIGEVARVAVRVREELEAQSGCRLEQVYVAAAGRALITQAASFTLELPGTDLITEETVSRLEAGAVQEAQKAFRETEEDREKQFFLVGYTVSQYYLDAYPISSILAHKGRKIKADIVATFLPGEVVESLYSSMRIAGLEVAGLTLEPIAAINVAIPEKLRLLNLAMVDIGAGTSDIAVCRDGKVVGYTMATLAGDEITESIMRAYLVDFDTAEAIKLQLGITEEVIFQDILGCEQRYCADQVLTMLDESITKLGQEIGERILQVNAGPPSAVFLAGGGSRLPGLMEQITRALGMEKNRASAAGHYFSIQACSDIVTIEDPEYATPLGILVSAGLNLINDSFSVMLNGRTAKLFSNGTLHISDVLMMSGYTYNDFIGRSGKNIRITLNGSPRNFHGTPGEPAVLQLNGADARISDLVHAGDHITFVPAGRGEDACVAVSDIIGKQTEEKGTRRLLVNGKPAEGDVFLSYGDVVETMEDGAGEPGRDEEADIPDKGQLSFTLNAKTIVLPPKADGMPYYLMDFLQYSGLDLEHITAPVVLKVNGSPASFQREIKENDMIAIYEEKN
nr:cell division FtsA domain-containing protein [uncultured Eisenbergiella sp.]